jgi:dynactin complex subunit
MFGLKTKVAVLQDQLEQYKRECNIKDKQLSNKTAILDKMILYKIDAESKLDTMSADLDALHSELECLRGSSEIETNRKLIEELRRQAAHVGNLEKEKSQLQCEIQALQHQLVKYGSTDIQEGEVSDNTDRRLVAHGKTDKCRQHFMRTRMKPLHS